MDLYDYTSCYISLGLLLQLIRPSSLVACTTLESPGEQHRAFLQRTTRRVPSRWKAEKLNCKDAKRCSSCNTPRNGITLLEIRHRAFSVSFHSYAVSRLFSTSQHNPMTSCWSVDCTTSVPDDSAPFSTAARGIVYITWLQIGLPLPLFLGKLLEMVSDLSKLK